MRATPATIGLAILLFAACGGEGGGGDEDAGPEDTTDAAPLPSGTCQFANRVLDPDAPLSRPTCESGSLEPGSGTVNFDPLVEGSTQLVYRGPQGGIMFLFAVRLMGFSADEVNFCAVETFNGGEPLGKICFNVTLGEPDDSGARTCGGMWSELLPEFWPTPEEVLGQEIEAEIVVADPENCALSAQRSFVASDTVAGAFSCEEQSECGSDEVCCLVSAAFVSSSSCSSAGECASGGGRPTCETSDECAEGLHCCPDITGIQVCGEFSCGDGG